MKSSFMIKQVPRQKGAQLTPTVKGEKQEKNDKALQQSDKPFIRDNTETRLFIERGDAHKGLP